MKMQWPDDVLAEILDFETFQNIARLARLNRQCHEITYKMLARLATRQCIVVKKTDNYQPVYGHAW